MFVAQVSLYNDIMLTLKKNSQQSNRQIMANNYQLLAQSLFLVGVSDASIWITWLLMQGHLCQRSFFNKETTILWWLNNPWIKLCVHTMEWLVCLEELQASFHEHGSCLSARLNIRSSTSGWTKGQLYLPEKAMEGVADVTNTATNLWEST